MKRVMDWHRGARPGSNARSTPSAMCNLGQVTLPLEL